MLRIRLLPKWVLVSLAANGFLVAALLALVLRYVSAPTASSASEGVEAAHDPSRPVHSADEQSMRAASATSELGPRHQLSYEEWKAVLAQEAQVIAEHRPERLTVLAGDSISLWFPETLLPPDRVWLNQGISGETSSGLLKRLNLFDNTLPETIFVMIGINDLLRGDSEQNILDNQEYILDYLQDAHPQAQIVVQSILPHAAEQATWEGRDRLLSLPNNRIRAINRELETLAQQAGVYYLDLYSLFADAQGNLQPSYTTDGLHLSSEGYQVWSIALQVYDHEVLERDR